MKVLLDTCAFLWFLSDSPQLSPKAHSYILDSSIKVYLSSVSVWEIAHKYSHGELALPANPASLIPAVREKSGIRSLAFTEFDALAAERLELFHKDPFDRMLIAQAVVGGFAILTSDRAFERYPIRVIW